MGRRPATRSKREEHMKDRVLSGMQASGRLHLGNLLGALENWKRLQDRYECFFFVADWHALTSNYADPAVVQEATWEMLIDWLAAGVDPEKSTLFVQSWVMEHAELHLLLSMITPLPWLERVPTYREKQQELKERDLGTYGFLGYPVLQAADILIYKAQHVPVGVDQLPHLELTREIARRFNHFYGPVFPEPQALLTEVPKLPGVDGRKMSKSYNNAIFLSDPPETVAKKIRSMITDPARKRRHDPGNPEVCTVYAFHRIYTDPTQVQEIDQGCRTAGIGCVDCKKILEERLLAAMAPFWERRREWSACGTQVREVAAAGSARAREVAAQTMAEVREAMKLR